MRGLTGSSLLAGAIGGHYDYHQWLNSSRLSLYRDLFDNVIPNRDFSRLNLLGILQ